MIEQSRSWRYGMGANQRVPSSIDFNVRLVGGASVCEKHKGRLFYRMTESHLEVVDPAGAGVVGTVERGLVRRVEIGIPEG